jgi:hypothetical protein
VVDLPPSASGDGGSGSGTGNPCAGKRCGDECASCSQVECFLGACTESGFCETEGDVACAETSVASGVGVFSSVSSSVAVVSSSSGGAGCPPDAISGEACFNEGEFCPASASCSGYYQCLDGVFTLVNPC